MARKVYKKKKHSCGLCKPHKVGWQKKTENNLPALREQERLKEVKLLE